jgi:ribokinase
MDAVVVGNVTLDVLCYPVEDVPRYDSISFDTSVISPGGCGSNVAIGLAACGVDVSLVARLGDDDAGMLVKSYWTRWGINLDHLLLCKNKTTAISIGLIDKQFQPRFIHTPGANSTLTPEDIDLLVYKRDGAKILCIAGYFVLLGLLDDRLGQVLVKAQSLGMTTILDVVNSPRMDHPETLWPVLPGLDVILCNSEESMRITRKNSYTEAAAELHERGARYVVVKRGAKGCFLLGGGLQEHLAAVNIERVVDTTGAGDVFAAGLVTALVQGKNMVSACQAGNCAGARIVSKIGAVTAWGNPDSGL